MVTDMSPKGHGVPLFFPGGNTHTHTSKHLHLGSLSELLRLEPRGAKSQTQKDFKIKDKVSQRKRLIMGIVE